MWSQALDVITGNDQPNSWWLAGIIITVAGSVAAAWLTTRRRKSSKSTEPAAAQSAREAVTEYRELFVVPLKAELEKERRARRACQERLAPLLQNAPRRDEGDRSG